jgi:hypothetical protein
MNTKLGGCESPLSALNAVQQPVATVAAATRVSRIGAAVIRTKTLTDGPVASQISSRFILGCSTEIRRKMDDSKASRGVV